MKIILAITGSIAAVRSYDLIRALQAKGHDVQCVLSKGGGSFVSRLALEALSGNPVLGPDIFSFSEDETRDVFSHINASKNADAIIIAPASANTLAKLAHGLADDYLQNLVLANASCPVLLAPAMNENMWKNAATQVNSAILQERGMIIIPPQKTGVLACGVEGEGKMATQETIALYFEKSISPQKYAGKKVLISLGGTQENIDSVRFIGNSSSGKTGLALANAFFVMGAEVSLVAGNHFVSLNADCFDIQNVKTTNEMLKAMQIHFQKSDIVVFSAAVADYTPKNPSAQKLEKPKTGEGITLDFVQTVDIAKTFSLQKKENQIFIGFCLASENLEQKMQEKLKRKGFDVIIGNSEQNLGSNYGKYLVYSTKTGFTEFEGEKGNVMREVLLGL